MRTKNYIKLAIALVFITIVSSCLKKPTVTPRETVDCTIPSVRDSIAEVNNTTIHQYIDSNNLVVDSTLSGLFYMISDTGTGANYPISNSSVTVRYKAYLTNGFVVDETARNGTVTYNLDRLILGWQYGIPLIKKGGKIKLIIPSILAYACYPVYNVPLNSVIIFDIELVNFQ